MIFGKFTYDIIFFIIITVNLLLGYFRGIVKEIFYLIGLILSTNYGIRYSGQFGEYLYNNYFPKMHIVINIVIAFFIISTLIYLVFVIIGFIVKRQIKKKKKLNVVDKIFGTLFGFTKGYLIIAAPMYLVLMFPDEMLPKLYLDIIQNAKFTKTVRFLKPSVDPYFSDLNEIKTIASSVTKKEVIEKIKETKEFKDIMEIKSVKDILNDDELRQAILNRDFIAVMKSKKFMDMLSDQSIIDKFKDVYANLGRLQKEVGIKGVDLTKNKYYKMINKDSIDMFMKNKHMIKHSIDTAIQIDKSMGNFLQNQAKELSKGHFEEIISKYGSKEIVKEDTEEIDWNYIDEQIEDELDE